MKLEDDLLNRLKIGVRRVWPDLHSQLLRLVPQPVQIMPTHRLLASIQCTEPNAKSYEFLEDHFQVVPIYIRDGKHEVIRVEIACL